MSNADIGFGITITFASGFLAEIINVDFGGMSRNAVSTLHSETPEGWETFLMSRIKTAGTLDVTIAFNPSTAVPIDQPLEDGVINFPTPTGMSQPPKWAAKMGLTNYKPAAPIDERMTADVTLQLSGKVTITPAS